MGCICCLCLYREESRAGASVELDGDKAVDIGLQSVSMAYVKEKK